MSTVAIVPAAGLGTRLRPLSDAIPKELLPVGRALAADWVVEELSAAGLERIVFVVSPAKEARFREHFDAAVGVSIEFAVQTQMLGLGDAILKAEPFVREADTLVVALGDAVMDEPSPGGIVRRLLDAPGPIAIAVQRVPGERLSRYGVVKPAAGVDGASFPLSGIVEKPAPGTAPSAFAVSARYRVPASIFGALRRAPLGRNGELQITEALADMVEGGTPAQAVPLLEGEVRHDIGSYDTYFKAFAAMGLKDPNYGAALREYLKEVLG